MNQKCLNIRVGHFGSVHPDYRKKQLINLEGPIENTFSVKDLSLNAMVIL